MSLLQKTDNWMMTTMKTAKVSDVKKMLLEALTRPEMTRPSTSNYKAQAEMLRYLSNLCEVGEGNEWLHADDELWKNVCEEAYDECSSFKLALLLAIDYKMAKTK
jgi:hypothetical protein